MGINFQKTDFWIIDESELEQTHKAGISPQGYETNDVFVKSYSVMYKNRGANKLAGLRFSGNTPDDLHFSTRYGPDVWAKYQDGRLWVSGGQDEDEEIYERLRKFDTTGLVKLDVSKYTFQE
jgi:hypothetical protein